MNAMYKQMLRYLLCSSLSLLVFTKASAQKKIYFNPEAAGTAKQSRFIEIVNYIPLETTPTQINDYSQLIITRQYFIVQEHYLKRISFFSRDGKFVKKIDLKKYGQPSITYDETNEQLKFNIQNKNYLLTSKDLEDIRANYALKKNRKYFRNYAIDLKDPALVIKKIPIDPYLVIGATSFYDSLYYKVDLPVKRANDDSTAYELQLLKNYIPVKSFFAYNRYSDNRFKNLTAYANPKVLVFETDTANVRYLARQFNPAIYRMKNDSIQLAYQFILPLDVSLPSSFFSKGFKSVSERENFQASNGNRFNSFTNFVNFPQYFFISVSYMRRSESYFYDKQEEKFYKTSRIKADSSQYNLTLLTYGLSDTEKDLYYKVVKANDLTSFYEANKKKLITYPPVLERFFKTATKNSNPVIVVYKIKDTAL